ncbi:hypothetical protein SAMN04490243_2420 [Robiginitalea myxolifaciens]|uniref:Heavy-metal resistance n=1 Tax=Robiginitalea myxolifaciens TaxID=400055 RepID=A0A1I6H8I9_9FLAO|nr:hypothetical protein [Robiginitalea myxolifaciens]SFR50836.1 hypothetical protein SAMN04490243_2420 [Robiginitalea myxolifaciens]
MHRASGFNGLLCASFFLISSISLLGQDCTLGLGGKDSEIIRQVFQLNAEQTQKMRAWEAELSASNESLEREAMALLDEHPQNTLDELEALGNKYGKIRDAMVANAKSYDQLLLGTFNQKQYALYLQLCREAVRNPLPPSVEVDPGKPKETPKDSVAPNRG